VQGGPTELTTCSSTVSSIRRRSRRSSTPQTPTGCASCRASASHPRAAVDSIQLVSRKPLEQVRVVAVTPESATFRGADEVLLPEGRAVAARRGRGCEAPDRRRGAQVRVRGSDPALDDLGRLWLERTGVAEVFAVWACPEPLAEGLPSSRMRSSRRCGSPGPSPSSSPTRRRSATATRPASSRATSRSCATRFGPRSGAGLYTFLELWPRRRPARDRSPSFASCRRRSCCGMNVADVLEKALDGERIDDEKAVHASAVARPRRGRADGACDPQPQARSRSRYVHRRPHLNYTNICVTDCDFCLLRSPATRGEGYSSRAGDLQEDRGDARDRRTGLLMQGGHHRISGSTTTRISSGRSRRSTGSTYTPCRRPRFSTSPAVRS